MDAKDLLMAIRAFGLTQVQISERTGVAQSTISKIERGEVADIMSKSYRALQALHHDLVAQKEPEPEARAA